MFANGGGIPLEHCTLTDDGVRCAIEYNCVRWGVTEIPPQAGVAIYERGTGGVPPAAPLLDDLGTPAGSGTSSPGRPTLLGGSREDGGAPPRPPSAAGGS